MPVFPPIHQLHCCAQAAHVLLCTTPLCRNEIHPNLPAAFIPAFSRTRAPALEPASSSSRTPRRKRRRVGRVLPPPRLPLLRLPPPPLAPPLPPPPRKASRAAARAPWLERGRDLPHGRRKRSPCHRAEEERAEGTAFTARGGGAMTRRPTRRRRKSSR